MSPARFAPHFIYIIFPIHILALIGVVYIIPRFEIYHFLLILLGYTLFSGLGVAIGFHRLLSHRSFATYSWIERIFSTLGCYAAQGSPLFWKALHMGIHHPYSDQEPDIHTPTKGFWHAYMGWQIDLEPRTVPLIAAKDLLINPFQLFLHKNYNLVYWTPFLALSIVRFDWAVALLIIPSFLSLHIENFINAICHSPRFGYQNFPTKDDSRNVFLLGLLCFGQGWHNNHHRYPKRSNYGGERWFEIDPSLPIVSLVKKR